MSDIKKQLKPQAKRVSSELKSQILREILQLNSHIPKIAKRYNLSSTTLYSWRSDYNKKFINDHHDVNVANRKISGDFVELLPEKESSGNSSKINSDKIASLKSNQSKLSAISCMLDNNISLSLKGSISASSLIKIINCLEKEEKSCNGQEGLC